MKSAGKETRFFGKNLVSHLQVRDLGVDLDEFHLREIDLDVAPGEYFVILGPTGGGKTVLLETIAGLHRPRRGRILVGGEEITAIPPERRGVGFVYQDYALFPHLNVAQNIGFGLKLRREERAVVTRPRGRGCSESWPACSASWGGRFRRPRRYPGRGADRAGGFAGGCFQETGLRVRGPLRGGAERFPGRPLSWRGWLQAARS
ncbi:MAG: hypothetical protein B6I35_12105 [Anaerolineaceae bacterium 4572_32.2]|nr:MAG: hypothetical protein B6I35_12105 [Anaerolineaceae bacterium 4572_32.2]